MNGVALTDAVVAAAPAINRCRGCLASQLELVFSMAPMPLAGGFAADAQGAADASRYPLSWVRCERCGLVQVLEDIADDVLFRQYRYASSTVPGLVRHFEAYARFLADEFAGDITLVEIGANDGVLLRRLPAHWRRIGVDPSDIAARAADGTYELVNERFDLATARGLGVAGTVDVVTASNVLAHFTGLAEAFEAAALLLRPGGALVVEVHDLAATLASGQWDTIYHEHKAEWSLTALRNCVEPRGFELESAHRVELHGGLIRARFRRCPTPRTYRYVRPIDDFRRLQGNYAGRMNQPWVVAAQAARRLMAYGAAGRAVVCLNQMPDVRPEAVVDGSPERIGRWIPGVAIPVIAPDAFDADPPDACVITAWNYAADIKQRHAAFGGAWYQTW